MKKTDAYNVIDQEIKFCRDPLNHTMPDDWIQGFIEGLKQAKRLIRKSL